MKKCQKGVLVDMTAEEISLKESLEAAYNAEAPQRAYEQAKRERTAQVAQITVTTTSGKTFDGDEESQNRMARVVAVGSAGETTNWKLSDNTWVLVTYEELSEALRLAGEAQTAIWNI